MKPSAFTKELSKRWAAQAMAEYANAKIRRRLGRVALLAAMSALGACASVGSSGPSTKQIMRASQTNLQASGIKIIEVTDAVSRQLAAANLPPLFSEVLGPGFAEPTIIGPGDAVEITIVEAPPAVLFSSNFSSGTQTSTGTSAVRPNTVSSGLSMPQQMVDLNGRITVPFAGSIQAAGRTPQQIERQIVSRLQGKAHDPQVIVRRVDNATANVAVLGDVENSGRITLSARGERLLDVLASAGGTKGPLAKSVVQVTRGDRSVTLPLSAVVTDARQNIVLSPNDVVTVLHQPFTFTALGASGTNAEIPLEGTSVSLSQALGRIGGLQDNRADVRGVFIFRFEDPRALDPRHLVGARTTADGKVPVIYRVDLTNPATLLVSQNFPIKNKDVVYVANAPLSDLAKFVNIVSSLTFTLVNLGNTVAQ
jgi:polysaccharide export outer membrane protein